MNPPDRRLVASRAKPSRDTSGRGRPQSCVVIAPQRARQKVARQRSGRTARPRRELLGTVLGEPVLHAARGPHHGGKGRAVAARCCRGWRETSCRRSARACSPRRGYRPRRLAAPWTHRARTSAPRRARPCATPRDCPPWSDRRCDRADRDRRPASRRSCCRQSQGVGTSDTVASRRRRQIGEPERLTAIAALPTRKNGSRPATSQKQTSGEPGSSSRAFITRIGPPQLRSIVPS